MGLKRIVFITETRFCLRDYKRFGIELLQENGFCVEIWDLAAVLHPNISKSCAPGDLFNDDIVTVFTDGAQMQNKLSSLSKKDFVITLISYRFCNLEAYRALSRSGAEYAIFCAGALPLPDIKDSWQHILLEIFSTLSSLRRLKTWKALFMKLPFGLLGVKAARLVLAGGHEYIKILRHPVDKYTEVLQIHSQDYDLYLKEKGSPCTERPIAVFLDELFPFHPDWDIVEDRPSISATGYFSMLDNFFAMLEEKTGYEVVIAAHPRSHYEDLPDYFKGRTCIKGKTINLVRECKVVLVHSSTAINFAVFYNKPVIFLTWPGLYKTYNAYWISEMAKQFEKKPVFIDRDNNIDLKAELTVNEDCYDKYRNAFIKTKDSEDLPFWQIAANRFKKGL